MHARLIPQTRCITGWAVAFALLFAVPSSAATIRYVFAIPIAGDPVEVTLTLADAPAGDGVDVAVSIPPGSGDPLGVFGNVADEAIVPSMAVEDSSGLITQWQFKANKVSKVGGGNVMNPVGTWDWGVRIGQQGSAGGAVETASFRLTGPGLDVAQLAGAATQGWVLGVRIQSTAGPEGSSKMGLAVGVPPVAVSPAIAIDAPANGALLAATPVTVTGAVTGTDPVVTVNGVPAAVTNSTFSAQVPLVEGANTLTAAASNDLGNASDAVAVTLDTTPPVVTFTTPPDGSQTAEPQVLAQGTVADASPITSFTVNGAPVPLVDGAFSSTVEIVPGDNTLTAVATDALGHQGSDSVTVTRGEAPAIAIATPADGAELETSPVIVTGTVSGTPPLTVGVNGVAATVAGSTFIASLPLQDGPNILTATATSEFGHASDAVTVTLAAGAELAVAIQTPPDGATVSGATIAVAGTVSDTEAAVTLNGVVATVTGTSWVAAAVKLAEGENLLTATATRDDRTASDTSTVLLNLPPNVVITSPWDGTFLRTAQTDVDGYVDDPAAFVDVNGVVASVESAGRFLARGVPLAPGSNRLTARAIDAQGATGRDDVGVVRDDASAGRLRIVLVIPGHAPRPTTPDELPEPEMLVVEDAAEFGEALRGLGFPPELFSPPIEAPATPFSSLKVHAFVFAEAGVVGAPIALAVDGSAVDDPPLLPMGALEAEMEEAQLEPSRRDELVPEDFVPSGFARFTFFVRGAG